MTRIKIAIVGLGKIARDQHVRSLAASEAFELVADPHGAKMLVELDFLQTGQQTGTSWSKRMQVG
jgi:predicted dehydrogenase